MYNFYFKALSVKQKEVVEKIEELLDRASLYLATQQRVVVEATNRDFGINNYTNKAAHVVRE